VTAEVDEIIAARDRGDTVWPVIDYADIEAGTVPAEAQALLRRRGCLIVRGHFDRDRAGDWDRGIVDNVESNCQPPWQQTMGRAHPRLLIRVRHTVTAREDETSRLTCCRA
jgi:hypothetical protein